MGGPGTVSSWHQLSRPLLGPPQPLRRPPFCAYKAPDDPTFAKASSSSRPTCVTLRFSRAQPTPALLCTTDLDFDGFHVLPTNRRQLSLRTHFQLGLAVFESFGFLRSSAAAGPTCGPISPVQSHGRPLRRRGPHLLRQISPQLKQVIDLTLDDDATEVY